MNKLAALALGIYSCVALSCNSQQNTELKASTTDSIETDTVQIPDSVFETKTVNMFREQEVRATGNEPFWMLEIKEDSVHFKLMGGFEFRERLPVAMTNNADSLAYKFQTGSAKISLIFLNKQCIDGMSGFKSPFEVILTLTDHDSTTQYSGCADYISEYTKIREKADG